MTILVLGGRGKTASRLSLLLDNAGVPFLVGSSSTSYVGPYKMTHFDWLNEDTWTNVFLRASLDGIDPISAVYLVGGHAPELVDPGIRFINVARAQGVNRFVLLSASNIAKGTHSMGILHAHLDSLEDVQYVVLRPTWFMENLLEDPHVSWIKKEDKIYSATGDGKIPFISADDIARVAFSVLTEWKSQRAQEYFVLGPELLSYDQVADILTTVLGRKITHVSLAEADLARLLRDDVGLPPDFAAMLASMETDVKHGTEVRNSHDVKKVTGSLPCSFLDFAEQEKARWMRH
ncbi:hypothetical protein KXW98_004268 [Aspergillus fumigatus]|uniref:Festuclavine dehydrogenase easG n=3 Tax=Aspergillus fumigatus TaxID=746128 RepID=EASG_ASPFU|nr:ergot alkaloid biosynthetic protein A [Aspergillus fumigatus Af293]Q4WZ69.1 RecName: Full=Festuclavine dehydrogenase easG; AltName: Full=Ergot alkaloid biosynthetic protein G [Aspergillus fumigatus Af293]EDP55300.1 ergot alkaloid biosynthetic protein A [Aspergillus fumigatus A1163]KAF4283051.1 hypothetical protein CNMCM8689_007655 [Aspergillus fumigatus]EAL94096.1 ergot alkaloid biosynthetic protein A [Aspergillus fumigatus Af293]KAF4292644.1 hypothetical protein CNMCM8686_007265 [Aspergill